jgi:hypothetical protein
MAFHPVSVAGGRKSPGQQTGRTSPTANSKRSKYICLNNNNNNGANVNNNNNVQTATSKCCGSHCDTQQNVAKRCNETSSVSTFLDHRSTLVKTGLVSML